MASELSPRERARRILATRAELESLVAEGTIDPADLTLANIRSHHDTLLAGFVVRGDVDLSREEERLSAGMRFATLLGAAALSIAWGMFATSLWDDLGHTARMALVWLPPLLLLFATTSAAKRESTGYVANIVATVGTIAAAVAGFATVSTGSGSARWPFLLFGAYGMVLAYRHRLVLPLLVGIVGVGGWIWSLDSLVHGTPAYQFEHSEPLLICGLLALAVGVWRRNDPPGFSTVWRLAGVCAIVAPLLILGLDGTSSWFGRGEGVELAYQAIGFLAFVGMVIHGLGRDDAIVARGGATALVLFLFFRMVDWLWDVIPDWLFFLLVGALAFAVLRLLKSVRDRGRRLA